MKTINIYARLIVFSYFTIACICMMSCNKEFNDVIPDIEQEQEQTYIDPQNVNALNRALIMPEGATRIGGASPSPSNSNAAPEINASMDRIISSNGSTALLNFSYENAINNLSGCYVQVEGADDYYILPYDGNSGQEGMLQLPLGLPTNVLEGEFCIYFCVFDQDGLVSNRENICITVEQLGTGALQISLSWDNYTDQDLHVVDPSGFEIFYAEPYSYATEGSLDRDDVDGFGPENIFWSDSAPDGIYEVKVNDYEGTSTPNYFTVTISSPIERRSFSGSTSNGQFTDVVTFVKSGDQITFR